MSEEVSKCMTCGAENPRFSGLETHLVIKTAEGRTLFSVDTKSDECQDCVGETLRMMHGEMNLDEKSSKGVVKHFINVEEIWTDVNKRPIEFLTEEQREERIRNK